MKSRLTFLDIAKILTELKSLLNCRLANLYDLNTKTILLKFSQAEAKEFLLIEPGTRMHKTDHLKEKSDPSAFNLKLRKFLRTKRLVAMTQLGNDRIIKMTFGTLDPLFLFCEFYSQGNIILTDSQCKIIALQRIVPEKHAVGLTYDQQECYSRQDMTMERLVEMMDQDFAHNFKKKLHLDYPVILLDHVFDEKIQASKDEENVNMLLDKFRIADDIIQKVSSGSGKGYILQKKHGSNQDEFIEYLDVQPWNFFSKSQNSQVMEYDTFNEALDVYFSSIESQKMEKKSRAAKSQADKKLEAAKKSHENQIKAFDIVQENSEASAQAIELHLHQVDDLLQMLRGYIGSGIDWVSLGDMLKEQARRGNTQAKMVVGLKLEISMVTIQLPDPADDYDDESSCSSSNSSDDSDQEQETPVKKKNRKAPLKIDLDINSSAYANARRYYDSRKIAASKQEKTLAIADKMLKNTEKKIMVELKSATKSIPTGIVKMRKAFWFEKFLWFISTENYLVIGGRDASQNELLVKKYLGKDDAYVHADLHGASSVIVKNITSDPIPPTTLFQAGVMSVVQSKAWDSKIVTSAWWVSSSQVSKTAPSGEYLTTGSFMIRGKKNWLPPVNLVYGFGLFFKIDDSCIGRHFYERRPWARNEDSNQQITENTKSPDAGIIMKEKEDSIENVEPLENAYSNDSIQTVESVENGSINENTSVPAIDDEELRQSESDSNEEFPDTIIKTDPLDKYDLAAVNEALNESSNESDTDTHQAQSKSRTPHLSAKQRRDLKKGGKSVETSTEKDNPSEKNSQATLSQKKSVPRGKKGKLKKIKEKYAEQDDEDREAITKFLGSAQGPQPKGKKAKAEAARKARLEELQREKEARSKPQTRIAHVPKPKNESDEIQQILDEEKIALPDEDQVGDLTYLDSLTGQPHADDILLFAIPVCAPWTALQKFKYKVKLTPGSLKKGKAAKSALSSFIALASGSEGREKELELIKSIQENELITQILGKVKITGATGKK